VATIISVSDQPKQNIIQAVRDYGKRLFLFIRSRVDDDADAEDILQDVWYRFSKVMSAEPIQETSAWLFRVARNRIVDQYRKQRPDVLEEPGGLEEEDPGFFNNEFLLAETKTAEAEDLRELFWKELFAALDELPEEQRLVFIWNELDDLSFNEIAAKTGEKVNTLISRKRYAVLHLRTKLGELYKQIIEP
jgi:RNA polymerase sigma factor (sigma-70 family)